MPDVTHERESVNVLGVRIDAATLDEAAGIVLDQVRANRAGGRKPLWTVVTPNPEIVMAAQADPELRAILNRADLAVADGVGVVWAARRLGRELPGRVAGFDLLNEILRRGAPGGLRVFFLGARPGVAEAAAAKCLTAYPGLIVTGTHHGYFPPAEDERLAALVAATAPDMVVVAMGSPRQEKWLARYGDYLARSAGASREGRSSPAQVGMPAGGSLDVLSGTVARAPAWAARLNLEWAVRVATQPARWRRAPTLARFVFAVLRAGGAGRQT